MVIEELTLEEKIGQLFMIELDEKGIDDKTIEMIQKYKIGGFILYSKNYQSYEEMVRMINQLKEINQVNKIPLWIAIDQEGGRVNRMPKEVVPLKNAFDIAKTKDIELVKKSGQVMGKMLKETGINMNFAPVLDIKRFKDIHAIGNRCYGENVQEVETYGIEVMKQIQKKGIVSVIKHFPGHGRTKKDSHFFLPTIRTRQEELEETDMHPFQRAIQEGADAIMVGHIKVKKMDEKYPASLSEKIVGQKLRTDWNYKGLVVTDDIKMLGIRIRYSMIKAVQYAVLAGVNMLIVGLPYEKIIKLIRKVDNKVSRLKIPIGYLNRSVAVTLEMKKKYGLVDEKSKGMNLQEINQEIEDINQKVVEHQNEK